MNLRPQRNSDDEPEINLTPLIDVVFLLLIFFMVTTSFIRNSDLRIELPEAAREPSAAQTEALEITVNADGQYFVEDRRVVDSTAESLRKALIETLGDSRDRTVAIRADADASHQAVVTVLDVTGRLGIEDVVIETVTTDGAEQQ